MNESFCTAELNALYEGLDVLLSLINSGTRNVSTALNHNNTSKPSYKAFNSACAEAFVLIFLLVRFKANRYMSQKYNFSRMGFEIVMGSKCSIKFCE